MDMLSKGATGQGTFISQFCLNQGWGPLTELCGRPRPKVMKRSSEEQWVVCKEVRSGIAVGRLCNEFKEYWADMEISIPSWGETALWGKVSHSFLVTDIHRQKMRIIHSSWLVKPTWPLYQIWAQARSMPSKYELEQLWAMVHTVERCISRL